MKRARRWLRRPPVLDVGDQPAPARLVLHLGGKRTVALRQVPHQIAERSLMHLRQADPLVPASTRRASSRRSASPASSSERVVTRSSSFSFAVMGRNVPSVRGQMDRFVTWTGDAGTGGVGFHPAGVSRPHRRNAVPVAPTNQGAETRDRNYVGPCAPSYRRVTVAEVADRPSCIATTWTRSEDCS